MESKLDQTPRIERTLEYYFAEIMETAISVFLTCIPELGRDRFIKDVYIPIHESRVAGADVLSIFHQSGRSVLGKGDLTLLACVFCSESKLAKDEGNDELSWRYLLEAQRYVVMAAAEDQAETQLAKLLDFVRTQVKAKAARENVARSVSVWWETQQEAVRLVQCGLRGSKKWASIEEAARDILPELRQFLESRPSKKRRNFTAATPERTIASWLRSDPEVRILFGE